MRFNCEAMPVDQITTLRQDSTAYRLRQRTWFKIRNPVANRLNSQVSKTIFVAIWRRLQIPLLESLRENAHQQVQDHI